MRAGAPATDSPLRDKTPRSGTVAKPRTKAPYLGATTFWGDNSTGYRLLTSKIRDHPLGIPGNLITLSRPLHWTPGKLRTVT